MEIAVAQSDIRRAYRGGFAGQLVSSLAWFASAAAATWSTRTVAVVVLVVGGTMIFPLTVLVLRLMGTPVALPSNHPMNSLARQIAFTLPMSFPLIYAATVYRIEWFYPAFMIALGAHYLPFVFLYGMRQFAVLSVVLVMGGAAIGALLPSVFSLGGWVTASVLLVFAFTGLASSRRA